MTTKIMDSRREAFEAWYVGHALAAGVQTTMTDMVGMRGKDGEYRAYPVLHGKWIGYNAAIDSICVELPKYRIDLKDFVACEERNMVIDQCADAIRRAGLNVIIKAEEKK